MARRPGLLIKLVTLVIVLTVIPAAMISYIATTSMKEIGDYALESSTSLGNSTTNDSTTALKALGEEMIEQKSKDISKQVEIYLRDRPNMTVNDIKNDTELHNISVQTVGETGYTAIVDATHFVILTHKHPSYVGMDLTALRTTLPSFWAVIERSAGGNASWGYYDWKEPDGSIRQKYTYIDPINVTTADGESGLTLWATTYIDEFTMPVEEIKNKIANATLDSNEHINEGLSQLINQLIIVIIIMIAIVIICSIGFTQTITKPVCRLKEITDEIIKGNLDVTVDVKSKDEIGGLAESIKKMVFGLRLMKEEVIGEEKSEKEK